MRPRGGERLEFCVSGRNAHKTNSFFAETLGLGLPDVSTRSAQGKICFHARNGIGPSPYGPSGRGLGEGSGKSHVDACLTPHPALRATLSQRKRTPPQHSS